MDSPGPLVLQPGARLGEYELLRWLGEGGFAEVWSARRVVNRAADRPGAHGNAPSEQLVAIKVVRRGRAQDPAARAMFLDEAKLASHIHHPNVARVHETGEHAGLLYLVMEHVAGGSLEAVMRGARAAGEPVPVAIAGRLVGDLCAGLHAAHELVIDGRPQHVIHRDISPQNILVSEAGVPKLIDFGIAKARERMARATTTGVAKGKLAYMSPEQARVEDLDRRSDLWSICAVAYELFEGRPLVDAPTDVARLHKLANEGVRPIFSRVPPRMAAVLERGLSYDLGARPATADDLRLELERAMAREGLEASREEVAAFCARAAAREPADAEAATAPHFAEMLGAPPPAATVSAIVPPSKAATERKPARAGLALGAAALTLVVVWLLVGRGASRPEPHTAAAEAPTLVSSPPGASAPAAPAAPLVTANATADAATAPPASAPASAAASVATPPRPKTASPTATGARRAPLPRDDDQIE
jgi:serine/threonine-protein kinase